MKKLLIAASALLLTTGAFAQTKMSGSDARFGLKAGVNLARFHASGDGSSTYNENVKDNIGFNITGYGDFGVANNFFIQPGISLQNKGVKFESSSTVGDVTTTVSNKTNLMVVEVPVNAVFRIPTGDAGAVQISAGPYVGFNISGKDKSETTVSGTNGSGNTSSETDLKFGSSTDKDYSSIDFGANVGLAYRLNSGLTLGANYGLGLSNLVPKDAQSGENKLTNRVLGFSVGYSF